jgi:hypothetical protein
MRIEEKFFVISAMKDDSTPTGRLVRHPTRAKAVEAARSIIEMREREGQSCIGFYILEGTTYVGPVRPKVEVKDLRRSSGK